MRHRLALIAFAAWDAMSLYISYNVTYVTRLGRWEGISLGLVVVSTTWLSASYLLGRYSPTATKDDNPLASKLAKTLLAAGAVVAVFIGHSWAYQVTDAQTRFRGFLIPLVVYSCLLSTMGQGIRSCLVREKGRWLLIGNQIELDTIDKELRHESQKLRSKTTLTNKVEIGTIKEGSSKGSTGIAVGTLESNTSQDTEKLLRLREKGELVIPLLSWCEQELQRIPPELVHSEWLIHAEGFGLRPGGVSWRVKRLGDVIGSILLMVGTSPVLLIAGLAIWLEDRGPVLYSQVRSGLYGKPICIWKLRSMRINAEDNGAQWASRVDPRITRVGRVIRAMRIDELPQLFNVISGDLSLIGPRPERPEIEEELENQIPRYRVRHWIRPGLSGWAQVCYPYGASVKDSRAKLSYDLYYLRNASLALDMLITMKTIRLVTGAKGASPKD